MKKLFLFFILFFYPLNGFCKIIDFGSFDTLSVAGNSLSASSMSIYTAPQGVDLITVKIRPNQSDYASSLNIICSDTNSPGNTYTAYYWQTLPAIIPGYELYFLDNNSLNYPVYYFGLTCTSGSSIIEIQSWKIIEQ
jgi:hypothetical protein